MGGGLGGEVLHFVRDLIFPLSKNSKSAEIFSSYREKLVSKEECYMQHNFKPNKSFKLGQIWRRQLHF